MSWSNFLLFYLFAAGSLWSSCPDLFSENPELPSAQKLTKLFDQKTPEKIREVIIPLLSSSKRREQLGDWALKELKRISEKTQKRKDLNRLGSNTIFVGAGLKTLAALATLKKELGAKFVPDDFLIIEKEDHVASKFYRRHFRLNSPFYDSKKRAVNHLENALFQLEDLATFESTPYSYAHDLFVITALNYRYLRPNILLNTSVKRVTPLKGIQYRVNFERAEARIAQTGPTNRVFANIGEGERFLPEGFSRGFLQALKSSKKELQLRKGNVYWGDDFLRILWERPREELNKFFQGLEIGVVGGGHESLTIIEALTSKIHPTRGLLARPRELKIKVYASGTQDIKTSDDFLELAASGKSDDQRFQDWMKKRYSTYFVPSEELENKTHNYLDIYGERVSRLGVVFNNPPYGEDFPGPTRIEAISLSTESGKNKEAFHIVVFALGLKNQYMHSDLFFQDFANPNLTLRNLESPKKQLYSGGTVRLSLFNEVDELFTSSHFGDPGKTHSPEFPIGNSIGAISHEGVRIARYIIEQDF